jgi:hypothetical protein
MDLAELLGDAEARGFTRNFAWDRGELRCSQHGECFAADDVRIVDSRSVDTGTDPADDATVCLIESRGGMRGFPILADSFHADPDKAAFIDQLGGG